MAVNELEGKVAIVTGSGKGIGRVIALRLSEEGAAVVTNSRQHEGICDAETVAEEIKSRGGKAIYVAGDIRQAETSEELVEAAVKEFGRLDILVNNAGITRDGLMMRMSEKNWDDVVDTHLKGTYLTSKAALKPMVKQKSGSIINVTSVASKGNPGQTNYSAAKAGMEALTIALAGEVGGWGIRVNAVRGGGINTGEGGMIDQLKPAQQEAIASRTVLLGRLVEPDEFAEAVLFFAGPRSRAMTGQIVAVDGGLLSSGL